MTAFGSLVVSLVLSGSLGFRWPSLSFSEPSLPSGPHAPCFSFGALLFVLCQMTTSSC